MFGWKVASSRSEDRKRYGVYLEEFRHGAWLRVYWGRFTWDFHRYHRDSRARALKSRGFRSGFAAAAAKGPVPRARLDLSKVREAE
jgi:hypothetical protein